MHKTRLAIAVALLAAGALPMLSVAASAQDAEASEPRHYSVETTNIGTLLDDPEAAAILERLIPTVYVNEMFQTLGRPNTMRFAQQYEPVLTEDKMAEIQAEFDMLAEQE